MVIVYPPPQTLFALFQAKSPVDYRCVGLGISVGLGFRVYGLGFGV